MGAAEKLATWGDLLTAPGNRRAEVLGGELRLSPRPLPAHGRIQAALGGSLGGPFDYGVGGPGGWWIVIEPDVRLGDHDIVSPDLVGWRRERVPTFPNVRPVDTRPDWICEVLSPSTARIDRTRKSDLYLRHGVPFYWLVDPVARVVEALRASDGCWIRLGAWTEGDSAGIPPFSAVPLAVGRLFPPQR